MKKLLFYLALCVLGFSESKAIKQFPLDEFVQYNIQVPFNAGTTTVMFPGKISSIMASKIAKTADQAQNADFLMTHNDGSYFFTLRAIHEKAFDVITVIYNRKAYVLKITASVDPIYTAMFYSTAGTGEASKYRTTPSTLITLLDKVKLYQLLEKSNTETVSGIDYYCPPLNKKSISDFGFYRAIIDEVYRFEAYDTVFFRVVIENFTDQELSIDRVNLGVRVGTEIYSQSLVDSPKTIPPGTILDANLKREEIRASNLKNLDGRFIPSQTLLYFSITGTANGGRNRLPANAPWSVLVPLLERQETDAPLVSINEN